MLLCVIRVIYITCILYYACEAQARRQVLNAQQFQHEMANANVAADIYPDNVKNTRAGGGDYVAQV